MGSRRPSCDANSFATHTDAVADASSRCHAYTHANAETGHADANAHAGARGEHTHPDARLHWSAAAR